MGLDNLKNDDPLADWVKNSSHDSLDGVTIGELKEEFGEESVNRSISYLISLIEADERYRESADSEEYAREAARGQGAEVDEVDGELQEAAASWEDAMQESGLGLDGGN